MEQIFKFTGWVYGNITEITFEKGCFCSIFDRLFLKSKKPNNFRSNSALLCMNQSFLYLVIYSLLGTNIFNKCTLVIKSLVCFVPY